MSKLKSFNHTFNACCIGYFVQAIINNFLPLLFITFQKDFSLPYGKISLLIIINFWIQLVVDLLSTKIIPLFGYKRSVLFAHILAAAGLCLLSVLPFIMNPFTGIILSIIVYATGSGLIEVIVSPLVEACPRDEKSASMSLLHSFYCWGQMSVVLLSTLFFTAFSVRNWRYLSLLWAIVPILNFFYFTAVPFPKILEEEKGMSVKELFKTKTFYLLGVIMLCAGAAEISMSQWASAFAESGLKVSKTIGDLLGPCLFAVFMGSARVLYAKFSKLISIRKALILSGILCVLSYLLACLSKNPLLALFGCGMCGFSVGVMWPGTFSLAAEVLPKGSTAMFALLALFGDAGCGLGPGIVGKGIELFSGEFSKGLLLAVIFPAVLVLGALLQKGEKEELKSN